MAGTPSWRTSQHTQLPPVRRGGGALSGLAGLAAMATTALVLVVGTVLAVIFAATLAVVMALATALLGLTALVWRMRRRPQPVQLQARRGGHSWVAYSWDGR